MDRIVGGKFKLGRKIGCGSFGEIYLGERADSALPRSPVPSLGCCSACAYYLFLCLTRRCSCLYLFQPRTWTPTRSSP
jgi:hypothetical protein